jgi:Fe-S cluster assembly ATP-binding protein
MAILQLKDIHLQFNHNTIIDHLNMEFWEGHIHAVVGPNGAGKSTLAALIMGLSGYRDYSGDILWKNESIKNDSIDQRARKGISLAWQEPARYEGLTVEQFITAASKKDDPESIQQIFKNVGLDRKDYAKRIMDQSLSGGERKKIELASILAMQPSFVLLDEPDSGIDILSIQKIFEAAHILKNAGSTVVLITHSLAVLEQAEHAFLMCCGQIIEKGNVEKIKPYFENECLLCNFQNEPDKKKELMNAIKRPNN